MTAAVVIERAFREWSRRTNPGAHWTADNAFLRDASDRHVSVWRMETASGLGAYTAQAMASFWRAVPRGKQANLMWEHHPGPQRDRVGMRDSDDWFYGFTSLDDLRAWFFSERGRIYMASRAECFPALYLTTTENVSVGRRQCAFKREASRRVRWLRPDTLGRLCAGTHNPARAWKKAAGPLAQVGLPERPVVTIRD